MSLRYMGERIADVYAERDRLRAIVAQHDRCAPDADEIRAAIAAEPAAPVGNLSHSPIDDGRWRREWTWFPVRYHLDHGEWTRGICVGKSSAGWLLVVDLSTRTGVKVVGAPDWFDRDYVRSYDGLVPECADEGTAPGQWERVPQ